VQTKGKTKLINPELQPFLERWDREWSSLKANATAADRRDHFEVVAANMALPAPEDIDSKNEIWIETKAGPVRVRVYRYVGSGMQPCLIYMHGGGWMQGSPETHGDITSRIASWCKQTVVSVDYALAPERPFPAAVDQVESVVRWVHSHSEQLQIDPTKISVGGDSAGANLAAVAALDVKGDVPLIAQILVYPACDFDRTRPSYIENPDGPLIKPDGKVEQLYCPNPGDIDTPRAAPLLASDHKGLPPAYIAVAEHDPLRDSGIAYFDALTAANVPVTLDQGPGLIHGYLRAMDYCQDSMTSLRKISAWLDNMNQS
jgi:acetyl esterase